MNPQPSTCRYCGRKIRWAEGPNGPIPMDPRPVTVYELTPAPGDESRSPPAVKVEVLDDSGKAKKLYISHFLTCPKLPNQR